MTPAGKWQEIAARPEEDLDLAEAALVIATEEYRNLDVLAYLRQIDEMAGTLKGRLRRDISTAETVIASTVPVRGARLRGNAPTTTIRATAS